MARRLATAVHVDGQVFKAGDAPPKEFAEQITNPKAWTDDAEEGDTSDENDADESGDSDSDDDADAEPSSTPRRRRNK